MGVKISPPFLVEKPNGQLTGISVNLLNELNKKYRKNIRFEKHELDGLLTALKNKTIDLSINHITVTEERLAQVDFSQPFYISNL